MPYQEVIHPGRVLSMAQRSKVLRMWGLTPNPFSLLRQKKHCCAFVTVLFVWTHRERSSTKCTPRKRKLLTLSTAALLMVMGVCVPPHLLKSTISSLVSATLRVCWFSWHQCVRGLTSLYAISSPLVIRPTTELHNNVGAASGCAVVGVE